MSCGREIRLLPALLTLTLALNAVGCADPFSSNPGSSSDAAVSDGWPSTDGAIDVSGKPDAELPSICRPTTEHSEKGLKPVALHTSEDGDWKVALEQSSIYGEIAIEGAGPQEAGASFDLTGVDQGVAGFIVSRPAGGATDVTSLSASAVAALSASLPGKASVTQLSSGSRRTSHDRFPMVVSTNLAIATLAAVRPGTVRDGIFAALLGKTISKLPAADFGPLTAEFTLRMQTLLRKDGRVLVMGGVAATSQVADAALRTGYHLEDLSNGTGLATMTDTLTVECDQFQVGRPVADIIWIVDESGSMDDNRKDIVANAADFFSRAVSSSLDFRMGVAGMRMTEPFPMRELPPGGVVEGKLCGKLMPPPPFLPFPPAPADEDDGGPDRFLAPNEQAIFNSCIENPPYWEGGHEYGLAHAWGAVTTHLPRAAGQPGKIRPGALVVLIIATDEAPCELKQGYPYKGQVGFLRESEYLGEEIPASCTLSASSQNKVDDYVRPWIELYSGQHPQWGAEARAVVHLIGGLCNSTCSASAMPEISHGYLEIVQATGGITADVCQKDLGTTLQLIIDSIVGGASPMVLEYVPVSVSIAVAVDDEPLSRSRVLGFDYVGSANSLVFSGIQLTDDNSVAASYRRWVVQETIK